MEMNGAAAGGGVTEVERLLERLGGNFPAEVARLTNQLLRRLAVKCKPGSLGKCEVCRPAVCVELACRQCGHVGVSRDALVQQSMVKEVLYRDVFRRVETALELTSAWSVPQMAIVLGGEQAVKLAERTLKEYQARYSNSLQDGGRGGGQSRPFAQQSLYVAAAFFLATKKFKIKVDKKRLLELGSAQAQELTAVCTSMQEMCADLVGPDTGGGRRSSITGGASSPPMAMTKKRGATEDFSLISSQDSTTSSQTAAGGGSGQKRARSSPTTNRPPAPPAAPATASAALQARAILSLNRTSSMHRSGGDIHPVGGGGRVQACSSFQMLLPSVPPPPLSASSWASAGADGQDPSIVVVSRLLRFKNEEEKTQYEEWKHLVLTAEKERQSMGGTKRSVAIAACRATAAAPSERGVDGILGKSAPTRQPEDLAG